MITQLRERLKKYMNLKQIDDAVRRLKNDRKFYDPYLRRKYTERKLIDLINSFESL